MTSLLTKAWVRSVLILLGLSPALADAHQLDPGATGELLAEGSAKESMGFGKGVDAAIASLDDSPQLVG